MAKQIKAAVIAALVVFVTAVTFGAPIGALGTFAMSTMFQEFSTLSSSQP